MLNALTIDIEEYYHGVEFEAAIPPHDRPLLPSRVEPSVARILDLLDRHQVQATFFIVGQVAVAHAAMVRRIASAGHEIACHSDRHELVWRLTPEQFRADIRQAKARLEAISGQSVLGYRAPNFSIQREQAWAYDILLEEGFQYDSSVYPILHDRYGDPDAPRFPYILRQQNHHTLYEFPLSTLRLLGVNLPMGGGGVFSVVTDGVVSTRHPACECPGWPSHDLLLSSVGARSGPTSPSHAMVPPFPALREFAPHGNKVAPIAVSYTICSRVSRAEGPPRIGRPHAFFQSARTGHNFF